MYHDQMFSYIWACVKTFMKVEEEQKCVRIVECGETWLTSTVKKTWLYVWIFVNLFKVNNLHKITFLNMISIEIMLFITFLAVLFYGHHIHIFWSRSNYSTNLLQVMKDGYQIGYLVWNNILIGIIKVYC